MQVAYEHWLVLLSCIVTALGSYVGFGLTAQIGAAGGLHKRMLLAGAAVVFAVAVWCMHFTGMLAARLPFAVNYLVFPALLSFLVCVILIGLAVFAVSSGPPTLARLIVSAGLMGLGVFFMHDIGAGALGASAAMTQASASIVASLVIAMALSGLALWLAVGREKPFVAHVGGDCLCHCRFRVSLRSHGGADADAAADPTAGAGDVGRYSCHRRGRGRLWYRRHVFAVAGAGSR